MHLFNWYRLEIQYDTQTWEVTNTTIPSRTTICNRKSPLLSHSVFTLKSKVCRRKKITNSMLIIYSISFMCVANGIFCCWLIKKYIFLHSLWPSFSDSCILSHLYCLEFTNSLSYSCSHILCHISNISVIPHTVLQSHSHTLSHIRPCTLSFTLSCTYIFTLTLFCTHMISCTKHSFTLIFSFTLSHYYSLHTYTHAKTHTLYCTSVF